MAKSSPQNSDNGPDDPSDLEKLQQQPFGAGALAPGRGNADKDAAPESPPGFDPIKPMGPDNPFAGIVAAHQQAQQQEPMPGAANRPPAGAMPQNDPMPGPATRRGTGSAAGNESNLDRFYRNQNDGPGAVPFGTGDAFKAGYQTTQPAAGSPQNNANRPAQPAQPAQGGGGSGGDEEDDGGMMRPQRPKARPPANDPNNMNWPTPPAPSEPMPGPPPGQRPPGPTPPMQAPAAGTKAKESKPMIGMSQTWKVGRSLKEHPERRLEMAEREAMADGNYHAAAQIAGQRLGLKHRQQDMDFSRERDATDFDQQKQMFNLHNQAQQTRDAEQAQRQEQMWQRDQAAQHNDQDVQWERQREMFGLHNHAEVMREDREQQRREQERNRTPNVGFTPIPGSDYGIPTADGRPMGTLPQHKDAPKAPTHDDISKHIEDMKAKGVKAEYSKGQWKYTPQAQKAETVKVVNDLGKVVDFPADHELPAGWKALQKKTEGGKSAPPKQSTPAGASKPSSFLNL